MLSTENLAYLNDLRGRVLRNEHVDDEELRSALTLLAENRAQAHTSQSTKRESKKPSIAVPDGSSLLAMMSQNLKDKK